MLWFHRFRKTERGQAMVEMALVLPILLIFIFGIIEFGRIINTYMIVTTISREGARTGAVGGTDSDIVSTVQSRATDFGLQTTNLESPVITPTSISKRARGTSVEVQVSYKVDIIDPFLSPIIGNPFIVTAQTTMRVE